MSFESDQRVVELQFNNKQFEADVSTTISTLDKLQNKLQFDGAAKGFADLEKAANKVNFDGLLESVNHIADRFTLKGTIIHKFFDDIANRALDLEHRMEKIFFSMTGLEQATVGWDKYADKTSAVQTIMSAVANEVEDVGDRMKYVNSQLETLNWFTDETSYNFLDMVNNIGKFTANQVPLDMAVESMQGIATWAAKSGANVGEASRAMYNLSQAISSGALKLLDWKSIELANMGTAEFKQTAIETAEAMGELQKVAEGVWETVDGTEVSIKGFRESLKTGWLSSDVLLATLNKYGGFATKLNAAVKETGLLTSDFLGAIEASKNGVEDLSEFFDDDARVDYERFKELIDDLSQSQYDFGRSAFAAAQEAKTFQEAVDAVKDAVSTGWMNSFEIIFGDYQEAKRLWTDLSNYLYDVFNSSAEYRNQMLQDWKDMGGRDDLLEGFSNLATALEGIFGAIGDAWRELFPEATWYDLVQLTKRFKTFTESLILSDEALDGLRNTFVKIFTPVRTVVNIFKTAGAVILALALTLRDAAVNVLTFIGESKGLGDLFSRLANKSRLFETALGLLYAVFDSLSGVFVATGTVFDNFNNALQNQTGTRSFLSALGVIASYVGSTFGKAIFTITEGFRRLFEFIAKHILTVQNLATAFRWVGAAISVVRDVLWRAAEACLNFFSILEKANISLKISERFSNFVLGVIGSLSKLAELATLIIPILLVGKAISGIVQLVLNVTGFVGGVGEIIRNLGDAIRSFTENLNTGSLLNASASIGILVAALYALAALDSSALIRSAAVLAGISVTLVGVMYAMTRLAQLSTTFEKFKFGKVIENLIGALSLKVKADAFLEVSKAVAVIAGAITILTLLDTSKMWNSVAVLSIMSTGILLLAKAIEKIKPASIFKLSAAFVSIGSSSLMLAGALAIVSAVKVSDIRDFALSIGGLSLLMAEVVALSKWASYSGKSQKSIKILNSIALDIVALSLSMKLISSIEFEDAIKAFVAVGALMAEVVALSKWASYSGKSQKSIKILNSIALDIVALSLSMKLISSVPFEKAVGSIVAIGGLMFVIQKYLENMHPVNALKSLTQLLVIIPILTAITVSLMALSSFADNATKVISAGIGIATVMLTLGKMMTDISKYNWKLSDLLGVLSASGLAVAVAYSLSLLVTATGDKTWDQIIAALGGFAIAAVALGVAVGLMGEMSSAGNALLGAVGAAIMAVSIAYSLSTMAPYAEQLPGIMGPFLEAVVILGAAAAILGGLGEVSAIGAGVLVALAGALYIGAAAFDRFAGAVDKFATGVTSISSSITQLGNLSSTQIKTAVDNIANFGVRIIGAIHDLRPKVEAAMYSCADYMIRGLQNGLSDHQKDVNAAASALFFGFQKKFEEAAQIQSPSVAMWKDGQYLIFGLVNGIAENQGYVYQAANGVWKYAHDGIEEDIKDLADEEGALYVDGIEYTIIDSKSDVQAALEELARDADSPEAIEEAEKSGKNIGKAVVSGAKEIIDSSGNMLLNFIKGTATGKKVTGYYEMLTGKEAIFLSKADEQNYKYMKRAGLTDAQIKQNLGYDPFDAMTIGAEKARRSFKDLVPDTSDLTDQFTELAGAAGYGDIPGVGGSGAAGSVAALGEEVTKVADITEFASESIAYYQSKYEQLSTTLLDKTPWDMAVKSTEDLVLWRYKLINADDEAIQSIKNYAELTDEQLNAAADSWREYFDTVANGISQGFGSVFSAPTFAKGSFEAELTSFKDMMKNLKAQENQMTYFTNTLIKLKKEGLNEVYLQSLLDAGPENLTEIISWDQLTAEEIKRINAQYEKIQNATTRLTMEYIETTANTFGEMPQVVEKSIEDGISNMTTYELQQDVYNKTSEILDKVLDADTDWEQFNGTRLGQLLDQGIADGVADMKDVAVNAVSQLAKEMIAELNTQVTNARAQQMQKMTEDWNNYVLGGMGGDDDDSPRSSNSRISDSEYDAIMSLKEAAGYLEYVSGSNNYDPSYKSTYEKMAKEGIDAVSNAKRVQNALDSSTVSGNLRAADLSGQISSAIATKTAERLGSDASYSSSVSGSKNSGYNVSITQNNYSTSAHTAEKLTQDLKSVSASVKK